MRTRVFRRPRRRRHGRSSGQRSPLRERDTNPELVAAAKALFQLSLRRSLPRAREVAGARKKAELKKQQGTAYFSNLLDKLNIEQGVANRAMMADYLDPKRFVWVFFADSFMWPFDNEHETRPQSSTSRSTSRCRKRCFTAGWQQENVKQLPASFDGYLKFVTRTCSKTIRRKGAIADEIRSRLLPPDQFGDPSREQAEEIYKKLCRRGCARRAGYRTFQDYIFRYLVREGGRLHLPVHIHTAVGIGDYFNISESNIMNLENILRDPALFRHGFCPDSWRIPAGTRGHLAGLREERLHGFIVDGSRHVSGSLQRLAAAVARDLPRQNHFRHRFLPVQ